MPSSNTHPIASTSTNTTTTAASAATIWHFSTIPLAQPTLSDPSFTTHQLSRTVTHSGTGHTLTGSTWNTPETIAHLLSFHRSASASHPTPEVRRFYTFGSGLNAHPHLLHGGVIAAILDSTMSNTAGLALQGLDTGEAFAGGRDGGVFTAQLNITYRAPVRTPGTVMVKAWIESMEDGRRKIRVAAVITGGERGEVEHARAEGLWVRMKRVEGKL